MDDGVLPVDPARAASSRIAALATARGLAADDYAALHRWSIEHPEAFWRHVRDDGVVGRLGSRGMGPPRMPGTEWFADDRINFAENLLHGAPAGTAVVWRDETGQRRTLTGGELAEGSARLAAWLREQGVGPGDVVAGVVPNRPETLLAMLATTRLGAVWSSCSPDFGTVAVLDRFAQVQPKVLVGTSGYPWAGRWFDTTGRLAEIADGLPGLRATLVIDPVPADGRTVPEPAVPAAQWPGRGWCPFTTALAAPPWNGFVRLPFAAPLYVMFSSGTTGAPKCIVHGIGGTLLKHLAEHRLNGDVRPGERLLFHTTCGWMMWNWLVGALASGIVVCLYDGSPLDPDPLVLPRYVAEERVQHLGISPGYLGALAAADLWPCRSVDLGSLVGLFSTGSPLAASGFVEAWRRLAPVRLASITGGTDIMGCFAGGTPVLPVRAGEIQAPMLGMAIDFIDDDGRSVREGAGELVCTQPFPSMPTGFWNDADGSRYRAAYFERFPGLWHHGDFGEFTPAGGIVIHGRSDAVLNRGGVRIGTAEIYRAVEGQDGVVECLAVPWTGDGSDEVVLFVRMAPGHVLDDAGIARIRARIRAAMSPRHVPDRIIAAPDLPRTRSGKLTEIAVREVLHGRPVRNTGALANPEALAFFAALPGFRGGGA